MRTIKYRGKSLSSGNWIYGYYYANPVGAFIIPIGWEISPDFDSIIISRKTVGEFTGLLDKNGKEIYENDVVKSKQHNPENYLIEFIEGGFCATTPKVEGYPTDINHFYSSKGCCIEVIGNIHENPTLIN